MAIEASTPATRPTMSHVRISICRTSDSRRATHVPGWSVRPNHRSPIAMSTRIVMIASALVMAVLGFAATFLPQEILARLGLPADGALPLVVQLTGALYLSFAMLNWTAKESVIGGIYNR